MPTGLDKLQHIVVLMMENRSFDHMLGSLKAVNPAIDGYVDGDPFANPDTTNNPVKPQAKAEFRRSCSPILTITFRQLTCRSMAATRAPTESPTCRAS